MPERISNALGIAHVSYRGLQTGRHYEQANMMRQQVGKTGTWRQYVSASAGAATTFGQTFYYREQTITGFFGGILQGLPLQGERQTPAGMIASGLVMFVSNIQMGRRDEVRWNGVIYRVESDPVRSPIDGQWVCHLKRGSG